MIQLLYPEPNRKEEAAAKLTQTAMTQPSLFAVEYALAKLWNSWGIEPQAMIGHSIGEFVAATLAGVFSVEDALQLVATRARLMQQQPAGSMLAVSLSEEEIGRYLRNGIGLATCNAPSLCVVSGPTNEIDALDNELSSQDIVTRALHTSHAFHSSMMDPVFEPFLEAVGQVSIHPPEDISRRCSPRTAQKPVCTVTPIDGPGRKRALRNVLSSASRRNSPGCLTVSPGPAPPSALTSSGNVSGD